MAIGRVGSRPSRIRKEVQGRYSETGLGLEETGASAGKIITVTSCLLLALVDRFPGDGKRGIDQISHLSTFNAICILGCLVLTSSLVRRLSTCPPFGHPRRTMTK